MFSNNSNNFNENLECELYYQNKNEFGYDLEFQKVNNNEIQFLDQNHQEKDLENE